MGRWGDQCGFLPWRDHSSILPALEQDFIFSVCVRNTYFLGRPFGMEI